jgi:serine protease Do
VKTVVADLEKNGRVTRGYLGVEMQSITDAMSKALHLGEKGGALVSGVQADSPAAKAGLEPGDVIASVDGHKVHNPRDLALEVAKVKPGEQAKLDVVRNGERKTITATLGQMPGEQQVASAGSAEEQPDQPRLGLALAPVLPEMRGQLELPKGTTGAVVARVEPGSPAEQAGIRPGDVIVGVGTKPVASPDEAVRAIRSASREGDKALALRILRDGRSAFVAVSPAAQVSEDQG